jgi:hypothetical protein
MKRKGLSLRTVLRRWYKRCLGHSPAQTEHVIDGTKASATLEHQLHCGCKSCQLEILITALRAQHLYPTEPEDWRMSLAVGEPFTTIEAALLDANSEDLVTLAFPALAPLIENEIDACHGFECEPADSVAQRPRGICRQRFVAKPLI